MYFVKDLTIVKVLSYNIIRNPFDWFELRVRHDMISSELYTKVVEVIDNQIDIKQLEEWLVPRLPTFLSDPDSADVVAAIELGLAEMSDGIRTREELSELLLDTIQEQGTILIIDRLYEGGSSNQTSQTILDFTATSGGAQLQLDYT